MKSFAFVSITAALASCQVQDDLEIVETASELTITRGDTRLHLVQGALTIGEDHGEPRFVALGRRLSIDGPTEHDYLFGHEGDRTLNAQRPDDSYNDFILEPRVVETLARWNVSFAWDLPSITAGLANRSDLDAEEAGYHWQYGRYFGAGACSWFQFNNPATQAVRYHATGTDSPRSACYDFNYGDGDTLRSQCNYPTKRLASQWCNYECIGQNPGAPAKACNTDADCPWGCGENGIEGKCSGPGGYCQSEYVGVGWTGSLGCVGAATVGPYNWCSVAPPGSSHLHN